PKVVGRLVADPPIGDLKDALDRIGNGADHAAVMDGLNNAAVSDVERWLAQPRTNREVVAMAALALTEGAVQRNAEALRARLEFPLSEHSVLAKKKKPRSRDEPMQAGRADLLAAESGGEPLFEMSQSAPGGTRALRFRKPSYRRQALVALW